MIFFLKSTKTVWNNVWFIYICWVFCLLYFFFEIPFHSIHFLRNPFKVERKNTKRKLCNLLVGILKLNAIEKVFVYQKKRNPCRISIEMWQKSITFTSLLTNYANHFKLKMNLSWFFVNFMLFLIICLVYKLNSSSEICQILPSPSAYWFCI